MDFLISLDQLSGDRAIRVGFAPGDGHYAEPYFFVAPQPDLAVDDLPEIPDVGHWHTKDFVGAVLTGSRAVEENLAKDDIVSFLNTAVSAGRTDRKS